MLLRSVLGLLNISSHLGIWLVGLNGEIISRCCSSELGGGRIRALLAPFVGVHAALETQQRDLHDVYSVRDVKMVRRSFLPEARALVDSDDLVKVPEGRN